MSASTQRTKERFDVNLDAIYDIKGQGMQHQECQIANLSSIGATVYFPQTESFKRGAVIAMDIPIPNTVMRICQRSFQTEPFSVVKSEPPSPHDGLISTPSFPTFPRSL